METLIPSGIESEFLYTKTCSCGTVFQTPNFNQRKCKRDCGRNKNRSRNEQRDSHTLRFVGVDGEGVDRPDGKHDYVMLSIGDKTLTNADGSKLTMEQIFCFLWEQYIAMPNAVFIGFYLGYDFTHWTKELTEHEAMLLWTNHGALIRKPRNPQNVQPFPVYVNKRWELDILAGRRMRLRKHHHKPTKRTRDLCRCGAEIDWQNDWEATPIIDIDSLPESEEISPLIDYWSLFPSRKPIERHMQWMYICDTGGFWQTSLMNALNPADWPTPVLTDEEYATLKRGKDTRAKVIPYGDTSVYAEMAEYNVLENDVLCRMTTVLNDGFLGMDTPLRLKGKDWYGPGRTAQEWLNIVDNTASSPFNNKALSEVVPRYAFVSARNAYYGGWFEQFIHGHIPGTTYEYDINSAYPYVIASLPCLAHGKWREGKGKPRTLSDNRYLHLVKVSVTGSNLIMGPLPHRTTKGRISRPLQTTGWHWWSEIEAADRAGLIKEIEIHEYVSYLPCSCRCVLSDIESMYLQRLRIGKKTPQGRAYKLVYNSAYGKFAQSIGTPKFSNPIYASLITSGCRTLILDAISSHPDGYNGVTMVATDGIYFRNPHPTLVPNIPAGTNTSDTTLIKDRLGAWAEETKANMTQLMPGVYWDDKTRALVKEGKAPQLKSRGISARDLAAKINELDAAFTEMYASAVAGNKWDWPILSLDISFAIVSSKSAIHRNAWSTAGSVTHSVPGCQHVNCLCPTRIVNTSPKSKRDDTKYWIADGVIRTPILEYPPELQETTYYRKTFGMELEEILAARDYVNQDGITDALIAHALLGQPL